MSACGRPSCCRGSFHSVPNECSDHETPVTDAERRRRIMLQTMLDDMERMEHDLHKMLETLRQNKRTLEAELHG